MDLIKYRWYFIGFFILTMVLSIVFLYVNPYNQWGKQGSAFNLGIDFTGGSRIKYPIPSQYIQEHKEVTSDEVAAVLQSLTIPDFKFNQPQPAQNPDATGVIRHFVLINTSFLNNTEQGIVIKALEDKFGASEGFEITRIDPLVGKELVENGVMAMIIASLLMVIYIWFRFELVSGIAAIVALLHDCLLVLSLFAFFGIEVNANIIAVLLTILGYSINDTIVIFDRIRENLKYRPKEISFAEIANDSILQTFRRSLNTGFTTIFATMLLYILVPNVRELCFGLLVGITAGTYSSIFVASPIWAVYKDWQENKKAARKLANATTR